MKKTKYLFLSLLVGTLGAGVVSADEMHEIVPKMCATDRNDPNYVTDCYDLATSSELKYDIDMNVKKISGTDNIAIEVAVKNSATSCDGSGLKSGKVYINLDENIVKRATKVEGIYRDYNESTKQFTESNVSCSYDGAKHRVSCSFGRTENGLVNYSDCKDQLVVTFETALCDGSTNCNIKVEVEGAKTFINPTTGIIGYDKTPYVVASKNLDCNSSLTNPEIPSTPTTPSTPETPSTPTTPENNNNNNNNNIYEPEENPNTIDNGIVYMLFGTLSLVLITTLLMVNKKKKMV